MTRPSTIWIQGAGDLASGVAVRLVRSGYRVVLAEIAKPLAVRRLVSFSEAVYEGRSEVEGIPGKLVDPVDISFPRGQVEVVVDPQGTWLDDRVVGAVLDARMTKKSPGTMTTGSALVIGLGPGFTCGRDADLIVETHREARLGAVIEQGSAAPNTGVAGSIAGQANARVLRSPAQGRLKPLCAIGDPVEAGDILGHVGQMPVVCGLRGMVRGLIHPQVELSAGMKVGDVDPRGPCIDPSLVSDKALAVGGGVLEALLRLKILP